MEKHGLIHEYSVPHGNMAPPHIAAAWIVGIVMLIAGITMLTNAVGGLAGTGSVVVFYVVSLYLFTK